MFCLGTLVFQMVTLLNPFHSLSMDDYGFGSIMQGDFGAWIQQVCYSLFDQEND